MAQSAEYRKCICGNACSYYVARCDHCREWYYMSCHQLTEKDIELLRDFYCKPCKRKNRTLQNTRRQHPTDKVATYERRQCDDDNPHAIHTFQGLEEKVGCICKTSCKTSFIQCAGEKCKRWCHTECISYTEEMADFVSKYYCPPCVEQDPRLMIAFETPSPPPAQQPCVSGSSAKRAASSTRASSQRKTRQTARGGRGTSATTSAQGVSSSTDHFRDNHGPTLGDEMYTTTTPTEEQQERTESGDAGADYINEDCEDDTGGEDEGGANGEPTVSSSSSKPRKQKSKRRSLQKGKKLKKSGLPGRDYLPDPYTLDSQECSDDMGLTNVDFPYNEHDYETITSAKEYNARFRPVLQEANPEANYTKLQVVLAAKYREYQAHLAELGRTVPKEPALRRSSRKRAASSSQTRSPRSSRRVSACGERDSSDTSCAPPASAQIFPGLGARYFRKRRAPPPRESAPHQRRAGYDDSGSPCTPTTTTDVNAAPIPGSPPLPQFKQEEPQENHVLGDGVDLGGPAADTEVAQGHPTADPPRNGAGAPTVQVKQEEPDAGTDQALIPAEIRIQLIEEQLRNKDRLLSNAKEGNKCLLEVRKRLEGELATSKADYARLSEDRKRDAETFARTLAEKESEMAELRRQLAAANHQQPSTSAADSGDAKFLARIRELENELQLRDAYIARKTLEAQGNKE